MNIIKTLEKQMESGNVVILESGNVVKDDKIRGEVMKDYLAGLKAGTIDMDTSFTAYYAGQKSKFLSVAELITYIKNEPVAVEASEPVVEEAEPAKEPEPVTEPKPEATTEPEPEFDEVEEPKKPANRRRAAKK